MANATTAIGAMTAIICMSGISQATPTVPATTRLDQAYRAYRAGDYEGAYDTARKIRLGQLRNGDYGLYVLAQSAALTGRHGEALRAFRRLARKRTSRFAGVAAWRAADTLWAQGKAAAASRRYRALLRSARGTKKTRRSGRAGDPAIAQFRMAEADARAGRAGRAIAAFRQMRDQHPAHPLAARAQTRLFELGGQRATRIDPATRVLRAQRLMTAHRWRDAIAELALVPDTVARRLRDRRDYWRGMTMFKLRRQYKRAGDLLLRIYKRLPRPLAAKAMFHGARALSRADFDKDAIRWYQRVVREFPGTSWAREAQFLSGWLEYNLGNFGAAIPHLTKMRRKYPGTRWAREALWFLGFSYYMAGDHTRALREFAILAKRTGRVRGAKGRYWHARALQMLDKPTPAIAEYRALVGRDPFSWYALLARARLAEQGVDIPPFGDAKRSPASIPRIDVRVNPALARDPLIAMADELIAAGLDAEAGFELRRGERAFLKRTKPRSAALAMLMDRYRRAGNFNRPWMMSVVYGGRRALNVPPTGRARVWWQHAYPRAYRTLIDKWGYLGKNIPYYLYAIMRKESGYAPHVHSYANARGLIQMIPRTTKKVTKALGISYTEDMLYDPELNIKTGSWYIGRLLHKFKLQIPYGAGSYNSGPKPVMRWMKKNGSRPADEFVELVSYRQTREYMKLVTESYARYVYLYEGAIYAQPLTVDPAYVVNDLTY